MLKQKAVYYSFRLFGLSILALNAQKGKGWIRLLGYGFHYKNILIHKLIFSERIKKGLQIGKYRLGLLKQ